MGRCYKDCYFNKVIRTIIDIIKNTTASAVNGGADWKFAPLINFCEKTQVIRSLEAAASAAAK